MLSLSKCLLTHQWSVTVSFDFRIKCLFIPTDRPVFVALAERLREWPESCQPLHTLLGGKTLQRWLRALNQGSHLESLWRDTVHDVSHILFPLDNLYCPLLVDINGRSTMQYILVTAACVSACFLRSYQGSYR